MSRSHWAKFFVPTSKDRKRIFYLVLESALVSRPTLQTQTQLLLQLAISMQDRSDDREDIARMYYALDILHAKVDLLVKTTEERFTDMQRLLLSQSTFASILSQNVQMLQIKIQELAAKTNEPTKTSTKCKCYKSPNAAPGCSYCDSASNEIVKTLANTCKND
jgi:hypothetical protein